MSAVVIVIVALVLALLAVVAIVTMPSARAHSGRLSRRTRRADRSVPAAPGREITSPRPATEATGDGSTVPVPVGSRPPAAVEVPSADAVGVTRRQFFNRSLLVGLGLGASAFGASSIAFLWAPTNKAGFGGKINVGTTAAAQTAFAKKQPLYSATAKTYMVPYPKADLPKARKIPEYTAPILAGMEAGYVALYQRCVHLGCRVPWCDSSQWFECPCHGSKYNRVGEKKAGPAPRGLDRFVFEVSGGNIIVDTGNLVLGPPIGTNTTQQTAEGPFCV
jgi:cytochrome b6-f complex iron-sulfur subunit